MWKTRYKNIYMCKDPNLIISAVCAFPYIDDTIEKCNITYKINRVNNDPIYRELTAYINLVNRGRDFIPIAFSDKIPKLNKLQELKPIDKSYFWCVGYVSTYLKGGNKSLLKYSRSIDSPSYETLLMWFEYNIKKYSDSASDTNNIFLHGACLRAYINENENKITNLNRKFSLIYNNNIVIQLDREKNTNDWLNHLKNLKNRNIYEILVNDFI